MRRVPPSDQHRRLRQESLRRQYEEFIEQRIEEYKEELSRRELLGLADEAVQELEVSGADQLVLTEVLMLDHVDRLIRRRLKLPTFRRWREKQLRLRHAQQEPVHWGLDVDAPLQRLALCMEDGDLAVIFGASAASYGYLLAAYEVDVVLIDSNLAMVESAERRAASEGLAGRFQGLVVSLSGWFPDVAPALAVIDVDAILRLEEASRQALMASLERQTMPGGVHAFVPSRAAGALDSTCDTLMESYSAWSIEAPEGLPSREWLVARKP